MIGMFRDSGKVLYRIVKISGSRLVVMPTSWGLMLKSKCHGVDDIIDIDEWRGPVITAHPNSLGRFV